MMVTTIRVAQFSTFRGGGAGTAALRLSTALREEGVDSHFLSLDATEDPAGGVARIPKRYLRFYERALWRIGIPPTVQLKNQRRRRDLEISEATFTYPRSDHDLLSLPHAGSADLLHLHWVAGLLDWPTFFSGCDKPVVWTLHDMNPLLGGLHTDVEGVLLTPAGRTEEERLRVMKREAVSRFEALVCVAPSRWLTGKARSSETLGRFRHETIPNGVDTSRLRPHPKPFARDVLDLPTEAGLLLVVAEDLTLYRKGGDLLADALNRSPLPSDWIVVLAGRGNLSLRNTPVHPVGTIEDERLMALLYSAADLVVQPTRQDNLSNVLVEAACCGTPAVATPVGGNAEIVRDGFNGVIATELDGAALAAAIHRAISSSFDREAIRRDGVNRYDASIAARRYKDLYEEILGMRGSRDWAS